MPKIGNCILLGRLFKEGEEEEGEGDEGMETQES